jgi:NAD(P)-dependent dehydrogenase (short-subunit alcohol dehydrogenase family)
MVRSDMTKIALVTGAGSGIGRAVAAALSAEGYVAVLTGRRQATLEETALVCPDCLVVPADISDPAAVKQLFARIQDRFGRLDLLFNNAGAAARPVPIEELDFAEWQAVIAVNLTGTFLCTQEAVRLMKAQKNPRGGRIINNGSISAHVPRPCSAPYTATKHALTGLTKSIALDGRAFDIACGQIDIGNAETPLTARMATGVPQADGSIAAEPVMNVEDVARAVLYMASLPPEANVLFMTVMANKMPYVGRG